MMKILGFVLVSLISCQSLCVFAAEQFTLVPEMHHLRSGDEREWTEFPETAESDRLAKEFSGMKNKGPLSLQVLQQDVKQNWEVVLNEKSLGRLIINENDMVIFFEVPGDLLGENNHLEVRPVGKHRASDDIRVGEIILLPGDRKSGLSQSQLTVRVIDQSDQLLPARITLTSEQGTLQSVGTESNKNLAIRPGVIYTSTGEAKIELRPGRYTVTAGRGFEYSIKQKTVSISPDQSHTVNFRLRREVDTGGWVACDTHVHTRTHSGHGDSTVAERMVTLVGEGLEFPVAADHNVQIDHQPFAKEAGVEKWFTPVIGNEVTTKTGHFNIFPVNKDAPIPSHKSEVWKETLTGIFKTPGVKVAILNHARDLHGGTIPFGPKHFNDAAGEMLDDWHVGFNAMEIINSGAVQTDPMQLFRDWMALINRGYKITPVGSSDSHDVARHFVGQSRTYIRVEDSDLGNISIKDATTAFVEGRVCVSYGLMVEPSIGDAAVGDTVQVSGRRAILNLAVKGPSWISADEVAIFVNGIEATRIKIPAPVRSEATPGEIWRAEIPILLPKHDVFLSAVATGPGIRELYWPCAKPYQPDSPDWTPQVMSCSGAIYLDVDGDSKWSSAHDYAGNIVKTVNSDLKQTVAKLKNYDAAVATQTALILHQSGVQPLALLDREQTGRVSDATASGFRAYVDAWRRNEIARAGE